MPAILALRLPAALLAGGCAAAALFAFAPPALAQDSSDKVNMVIVYGNDACPQSSSDEITVCARKDEAERYRIPAPFRNTASPQDQSWTNRVLSYETVGATGTNSCSAVGPGGWTGCANKLIHNAYAERKAAPDVQFSKMIEDAREKRLSHIDADSAKQQAAVEQAEKDYEARQRATQDPESGDKPVTPGTTAPLVAGPSAASTVPAPPAGDPGK